MSQKYKLLYLKLVYVGGFSHWYKQMLCKNALGTLSGISLEAHVKSIQGVIGTSERVTS